MWLKCLLIQNYFNGKQCKISVRLTYFNLTDWATRLNSKSANDNTKFWLFLMCIALGDTQRHVSVLTLDGNASMESN